MNLIYIVVAICVVMNCSLAFAIDVGAELGASPFVTEIALTLKEAMDAAVDHNPTVRLAREKVEAAKAEALTQFGALLPNVSSTVRQSKQTLFLGTLGLAPVRSHPFSVFDARTTASQSIFSLNLIQRWQASRAALKVSEMESQTAKFDMMAEVGLDYIEALKAQASVKAHTANAEVLEELLKTFNRRQGSGMAAGLDIARLEGQLENERQQLIAAEYEAERLKFKLIQGLGISFEVRLSLTDTLRAGDSESGPTLENAVETAMQNRVEVQAQAKRIQTASLKFKSTTSERLPSLVAQGDYGLIGNRWSNTLDTYNVGLFLNIPIFDGGQREGRIREARSEFRQEEIKMQVVANQVRLEVRDAIVTAASGRRQWSTAQAGLRAAMTELSIARERFSILSSTTSFELANALFSVVRARENLIEALFRFNAGRVHLARALGKLEDFR